MKLRFKLGGILASLRYNRISWCNLKSLCKEVICSADGSTPTGSHCRYCNGTACKYTVCHWLQAPEDPVNGATRRGTWHRDFPSFKVSNAHNHQSNFTSFHSAHPNTHQQFTNRPKAQSKMEENATYPEFISFTSAMPSVPEDEFCVYGIVSESTPLYSTPHSPKHQTHHPTPSPNEN